MGIYKKIFQKLTGREDKPKKKRLTMAKTKKTKQPKTKKPVFKKLTPEQKKKALELFRKATGTVIKYGEGKPKVTVKPADKKQPAKNFWSDEIDLGFIKPTGTQLVIGATATALIGGAVYKATRK